MAPAVVAPAVITVVAPAVVTPAVITVMTPAVVTPAVVTVMAPAVVAPAVVTVVAPAVVAPAVVAVAATVVTMLVTAVVRGMGCHRGRIGCRAGGSGTAQQDGSCDAQRGGKTGNPHSVLLSRQVPDAPAWSDTAMLVDEMSRWLDIRIKDTF
ncbi:hypothetical protein [Streptomyces sp. NPDC046821]|uniref:hypothetical protein n=1 Tax=Streptomyces sp. NPDC046821 TaxID=3154702 RepID=UPI0033F0D0FE